MKNNRRYTFFISHVILLFIGCILYEYVPYISLFNIILNSIMIVYYLALEVKKYNP